MTIWWLMALGRHSAVPVKRQKPAYELLAWGGFISVACAASLWILDLDSPPGLFLSAMPAAAFAIVWFLARDTPAPRPAATRSTAPQPAATSRRRAPASKARTGVTAPTKIALVPVAANAVAVRQEGPIPAPPLQFSVQAGPGQPLSASPAQVQPSPVAHFAESRWVKEFGPPDTGPLPVQAYRGVQTPGVFAGSVEQRAGGRQWSHSRA